MEIFLQLGAMPQSFLDSDDFDSYFEAVPLCGFVWCILMTKFNVCVFDRNVKEMLPCYLYCTLLGGT